MKSNMAKFTFKWGCQVHQMKSNTAVSFQCCHASNICPSGFLFTSLHSPTLHNDLEYKHERV